MDRSTKISELKRAIKEEGEKLTALAQKHKDEIEKAEEADKEKLTKEYQDELASGRALYTGLIDELKITRMNKTGSTFFQWIPSGMNRQQRKLMRKYAKANIKGYKV